MEGNDDLDPEMDIDNHFMTAIGNAVYHNSMTKKHGSIQCPSADKVRPKSRKNYGAGRERFYMLGRPKAKALGYTFRLYPK